jgi:hypothetical protein
VTRVTDTGADANPEVGVLRRCIGDVVALSTLSAIWAGADRPQIAESLAQVLQSTLHADVVYVGLRRSSTAAACDSASLNGPTYEGVGAALREALGRWLRQPDRASPTYPGDGATSRVADRDRCRARRDRHRRRA